MIVVHFAPLRKAHSSTLQMFLGHIAALSLVSQRACNLERCYTGRQVPCSLLKLAFTKVNRAKLWSTSLNQDMRVKASYVLTSFDFTILATKTHRCVAFVIFVNGYVIYYTSYCRAQFGQRRGQTKINAVP